MAYPKKQHESISDRIKSLVMEYWGRHPYDINNGDCEEFANIIADEFEGAVAEWGEGGEGDHCFIAYKGKYYDAEEPHGVPRWEDLPLYHRRLVIGV